MTAPMVECVNCGHSDDDHVQHNESKQRGEYVVTKMSSLCHCGCARLTVRTPFIFSWKTEVAQP